MSNYEVNKELKQSFILESEKASAPSTIITIKTVLKAIENIENENNRDCYDFTKEELINAVKELGVKTKSSIWTYTSLLLKYIKYAQSKGKNVDENIFTITIDDFEDVVNKQVNKYITREELYEFVAKMKNPQDQMMFILLFEGVMGDGYDHLRLLKEEDINLETGVITLPNKNITVTDERSLMIIKAGLAQQEYTKVNRVGQWNDFAFNPLNKYAIKKVISRKDRAALTPFLDNRIKNKIRELCQMADRRDITGMVIYQSGLAERIKNYFADEKSANAISNADIEYYCIHHLERGKAHDIKRVCQAVYGGR